MKCGVFTLALVLLLVGYAIGREQAGESRTINLGPVTLHVGMSKESTLAALSNYYAVNDEGLVGTKTGPPTSKPYWLKR